MRNTEWDHMRERKKNWVVQLLPALRTLQVFFWQIIKISSNEKVSQLSEQVDFKLSNTIPISQYEIKVYYI